MTEAVPRIFYARSVRLGSSACRQTRVPMWCSIAGPRRDMRCVSESESEPNECSRCLESLSDHWYGHCYRGGFRYCFECYYATATDEERAMIHEAERKAEEYTDWLIEESDMEWEHKRVERRMRKFQTLAVMLLGFKRWSRRAVARVEAEYAADGPRGARADRRRSRRRSSSSAPPVWAPHRACDGRASPPRP